MLEPGAADRKQRALECAHCAEVYTQLHGKRRRTIRTAIDQHWAGHIPGRIQEQLLAADWILSVDELRDIQEWQPTYLPVRAVPDHPRRRSDFAPHLPEAERLVDEQRYQDALKQRATIIADNELATQHNRVEAATESARWQVLHHLEKLERRIQNHDAAQCGARAKRTGERCRRLAVSGKRVCRVHGGLSTGPSPDGRLRIAEYQRQRWAKWRQTRSEAA